MAEVFADGEPVDPIKLQKLQDQILAIELKANQAFSLSSRNVESGSQQYVYHTQAGVESFSNVTGSAEPKTGQIELAWGSEYDQVYTVATPRLKNPKLDLLFSELVRAKDRINREAKMVSELEYIEKLKASFKK